MRAASSCWAVLFILAGHSHRCFGFSNSHISHQRAAHRQCAYSPARRRSLLLSGASNHNGHIPTSTYLLTMSSGKPTGRRIPASNPSGGTADIFGRRGGSHPAAYAEDPIFLSFKSLNDPSTAATVGVGKRRRVSIRALDAIPKDELETPLGRLVMSVSDSGAVDTKELFESVEFYLRFRKRLRASTVVDLACGHGLTGLIFAALEPKVERLSLVDCVRPPSYDLLLDALTSGSSPHLRDKAVFTQADIFGEARGGAKGVESPALDVSSLEWGHRPSFLAIHACGTATDRCLEIAVTEGQEHQGTIAAMPCCYTGTGQQEPYGIRRFMGKSLATDIGRTYRLQAHGYHVDWGNIPRSITAMNRCIIATLP